MTSSLDDSTAEAPQPDPTPSAPGTRSRVTVVFYHREGTSQLDFREPGSAVVGRAFPADLVISEPSLSRLHARFRWQDGVLTVVDLESKNGTVLGGQAVREATLKTGDELVLGSVRAKVHVSFPSVRDPRIESYDGITRRLREEVLRSREFGRPLALLMLRRLDDGPEPLGPWLERLAPRLRSVDAVGMYEQRMAMVLLPELSWESAREVARRLLACAEGLRVCAGLALHPDSAGSSEELLSVGRAAALRSSTPSEVVAAEPTREVRGEDFEAVVLDPRMMELHRVITQVAPRAIPVLITGETGVGKEIIATRLHRASGRRGPLKVINCATIPQSLTESILFGHEKGSFTGATGRATGLFEEADGGTVFLDEIGELSPGAQAALLRVLQEKRIMRVGSTREIDVDVRVVAATHRNLEEMAAQGTFRKDLLYRLNAITLEIPPLRERTAEIVPLATRFLESAVAAFGGQARAFDTQVLTLLERYEWPGNVRELRNVIERAVALCDRECVEAIDLPSALRESRGTAAHSLAPPPLPAEVDATPPLTSPPAAIELEDGDFRLRVREYEIALIRDALEKSRGNLTKAAELLRMPVRTLSYKIKTYGMREG